MCFHVVGTDLQRLSVMEHRFVQSALLEKSGAKIEVGHFVVCGAGERVVPQGFAVMPIRGLFPGADHQHREHAAHEAPKATRLTLHCATSQVTAR